MTTKEQIIKYARHGTGLVRIARRSQQPDKLVNCALHCADKRVMRVSAPDGPTVIIRFNPGGQSPYASAHSWDDVWPYARNLIPCDQEQTDYRDLMFEVQAYINRELAKLAPIAA